MDDLYNATKAVYGAGREFRASARGRPCLEELDWLEVNNIADQAGRAAGIERPIRVAQMGRWEAGSAPGDACAEWRGGVPTIRLSRKAWDPLTVVHEVAHLVSTTERDQLHGGHGPYFVARYLSLVSDMFGRRTAEELAGCMVRHGVRGVPRVFSDAGEFAALTKAL